MVRLLIELNISGNPTSNKLEHPLILLLESVNEAGSIGKAAKKLNFSYRHVWGELKHWESELKTNLIIWGRTSKGATLTPEALEFLSAVTQTQLDLESQIAAIKKSVSKCMSVFHANRDPTPSAALSSYL